MRSKATVMEIEPSNDVSYERFERLISLLETTKTLFHIMAGEKKDAT